MANINVVINRDFDNLKVIQWQFLETKIAKNARICNNQYVG